MTHGTAQQNEEITRTTKSLQASRRRVDADIDRQLNRETRRYLRSTECAAGLPGALVALTYIVDRYGYGAAAKAAGLPEPVIEKLYRAANKLSAGEN